MIKLLEKKLAQSLKPAYKSKVIATDQIKKFTDALLKQKSLFDEKESEENQKKLMVDFLEDAFYANHYINTQARKDTVIHHGKDGKSKVGVIIETKRAKSAEMISEDKPNVKALHELIWYYFLERQTNNEVCHLIATDFHTWYIFDENEFDKNFYHQTEFKNLYKNASKHTNSSEWFYEEVKKLLANTETSLTYTCLSMNELINGKGLIKVSKTQLANIYKILSPEHLLKLSFNNDSNQLNQGFYKELLHIIGLEEAKDDTSNKKIIRRIKDLSLRNGGSLLENTLSRITDKQVLNKVVNLDSFGQNEEEQLFSIALELCITWLNRILFLKLLESQIVAHHKGDEGKRFLTALKIQDFDLLYELFFDVLAKSPESREQNTRDYFGEIPYLNSSLFEKTELEGFTISINQIRNRLSMPYYFQSVLKDNNGKRSLSGQTPTLSYLLDFLNAYNFGSNDTGDIIQDRPKDLISASVLGLIFEKLNGYKDGSFFTPSFITMYMCSQSIREAVVQKFNESVGDSDYTFIPIGGYKDFKDLAERLEYYVTDVREKANMIINNIHICDPAVGSGHFLVSALNELIQIKYDLKILSYKHNQKRINKDWKIKIDNDELRITHSDSIDSFIYNPQNEDHHNLQETLFHEKQTLIENCLFGVDINPKSVSICRLRLWIELLKNAYYKPTTNQLQVLPNIDINIKIGNSLVSRFGMNSIESYTKSLKNREIIQEISQKYSEQVKRYKNNTNSDLKGEIKDEIKSLKEAFSRFVQNTDKDYLKMKRKESELKLINDNPHYTGSLELQFSEDTPEQKKANSTKKTKKIESEFKELNKIWQHKLDTVYKYAFEWRYEFPEVFDTKGDFVGFDVVVGNPPYIRQEKLSMEQKILWLTSFPEVSNSTADIYVYFFGLGQRILKNKGFLSFITLNKWLKTKYGDALRTHLSNYKVETIIDFFELNVFEEASTDSAITFFQNELIQDDFISKYFPIKTLKELNLKQIVAGNSFLEIEKKKAEWKFVSIKNQTILRKFEENTIPLKNYVSEKMYMGIKTAANEVFIISDELKEELCRKDPKSIEIISPYLRPTEFGRYCYEGKKEWFINSHNGIVLNRNIITHRFKIENEIEYYMPDENTKIEVFRKEQIGTTIFRINRVDVENDYPAIFEYMNSHSSKLQNREDKGKHWTNLRNCDYIYEFNKPKIAYVYTAKRHNFYLDYDKRLINNSSYMIVSENKYLLAFLNSKLFEWYKKIKFVAFGDAEEGGRVKLDLNKMETVPVKQISSEAKTTFIDKIDGILSLKAIDPANDTKELESEIDELIFDLYDLSTEERNSVLGI